MANGFEHKDLIKSLKEGFGQYFNERLIHDLSVKVVWEFPDKDLEHAYISGHGSREIRTIKTVFKVTNDKDIIEKEIPVNLIENYKGTLTIKVNGKTACSTKPMEGINPEFLKSFANAIKEEI